MEDRPVVFVFGDFEADEALRELRREGRPVEIHATPLRLLFYLLRNRDRVIPKDELLDRVWSDTAVSEGSLFNALNQIRSALGDDGSQQRVIQTLRGQGYRLIAPVEEHPATAPAGTEPVPSEAEGAATQADAGGLHLLLTWRNFILVGLGVIALAGAGVAGWLLLGEETARSPENIRSIAVLPFADMSPGGDQEYFADGMSEELISRLSKIGDLRVVARTSAFAFKGKNLDIREIGEQLDVGAVVEGSVRKAGDRLRITAQLVQVADGYHLWSETYDRQLDDVFAIQDEVSWAIADALQTHLDITQAPKPPTEDVRAYELYLMGRFFWNQRSEEGHRKAIGYFERALELDPEYALAYSGLADAYVILVMDFGFSADYLAEAREAARRAVNIDNSLAEGHASLGLYRYHAYDWPGAELELRRALAINPAYAIAHSWYAALLMTTGRIDESLAEIQLALRLDPLSGIINAVAGRLHLVARDYDTAVDRLERALELNPNLPGLYQRDLAYAYQLTGREAAAVEAARNSLDPSVPPEVVSTIREALESSGLQGGVRKLLELNTAQTRKLCPSADSPGLYTLIGEHEKALECLQQFQQQARSGSPLGRIAVSPFNFLKVHPLWDGLRSDPRFTAILKEMGLND
jgi:TolB-like protein/DNA-binding winged helix-turn-helix (wHTH) protein/Tfp pilus assembly protein PilF